jgi:hypothetical protein
MRSCPLAVTKLPAVADGSAVADRRSVLVDVRLLGTGRANLGLGADLLIDPTERTVNVDHVACVDVRDNPNPVAATSDYGLNTAASGPMTVGREAVSKKRCAWPRPIWSDGCQPAQRELAGANSSSAAKDSRPR